MKDLSVRKLGTTYSVVRKTSTSPLPLFEGLFQSSSWQMIAGFLSSAGVPQDRIADAKNKVDAYGAYRLGKKRAEYTASQPERVFEKIRESQFFLSEMSKHETANQIEKYSFCLSAFLSAFRSAMYRAKGVTQATRDESAADALWKQLSDSDDIEFLKDITDLEIHGDGPKIWQVRLASSADKSRFTSRFTGRFQGRFTMETMPNPTTKYMQFETRPTEIAGLCSDSLTELENIVKRELPAAVAAVAP